MKRIFNLILIITSVVVFAEKVQFPENENNSITIENENISLEGTGLANDPEAQKIASDKLQMEQAYGKTSVESNRERYIDPKSKPYQDDSVSPIILIPFALIIIIILLWFLYRNKNKK